MVHLCLVFPVSMIIFALPSLLVLPEVVRNAVLGLPKHFGSQNDAERVDSTEKVVIWLVRSSKRYLLGIASPADTAIRDCLWVDSGLAGRVLSTCSTILWQITNSATVDFMLLHSMVIRARLVHVLQWVQNLAAVVIITPSFYFDADPVHMGAALWCFSQQFQVWLAPVGVLMYFVRQLNEAASDLDSQEYSEKQRGNSNIYAMLHVKGPEVDNSNGMHKSALIRVLVIEPGRRDQPFHCGLRVIDLASSDSIQYEALSHFWGPPNLAEKIEVNCNTFAVSTALVQAILHLRHHRQPRAIWMDAICINQADPAERGAQVQLMQHIYSKASRVIVWLGEEEPWGLKNLVEAANNAFDGHYGAVGVVSNLLGRPWWTRVWVTQELVLARDVVVCCGSQTLGWDRFCSIVSDSALLPSFPNDDVYIDLFRALWDNRKARAACSPNSAPRLSDSEEGTRQRDVRAKDLLSLIYDFRSRRATEPRDKVFAFQGLAQEIDDIFVASGQPIELSTFLVRPDYSRRESFMCIDLARRHIRRTQGLSVMVLAECARQTSPSMPDTTNDNRAQYLPSWCPAFMNSKAVDEGLHFRPFWTGLPGEGDDSFSSAGNVAVQALPPEPDSLKVSPDGECFDLDGDAVNDVYPHKLDIQVLPHLCDTIVETGSVAGGSIDALVNSTMKVIRMQASTMVSSFQVRNSWDSVLPAWRRMALEAYKGRKPQPGHPTFEEEFQLSITAGKFSAEPSSAGQRIDYPSSQSVEIPAPVESQAYLAAREATCADRASFVTTCGHFGTGPPDLQTGDQVCVVIGTQVPVILRKVGSANDRDRCLQYDASDWLFIGQAYVHEKMVYQGDLADDIRAGTVAVETRVLT